MEEPDVNCSMLSTSEAIGLCLNTSLEWTLPCAWNCRYPEHWTVASYRKVVLASHADDRPTSYRTFNIIVNGYSMLLLGTFGMIGNALSVYIYSRKTMRSTSNIFLAALGVSDLLICSTALFMFSLPLASRWHHMVSPVLAYGTLMVYPVALTAQMCSIYFTVGAAFDLLRTVWMRRQKHDNSLVGCCRWATCARCTVSTSLKTIYVVVLMSVVYNLPKCFEARVGRCYDTRWQRPSVAVCGTYFRLHYELYHVVYYRVMYGIFINGFPLLCLIGVCLLLAVKILCIDSSVSVCCLPASTTNERQGASGVDATGGSNDATAVTSIDTQTKNATPTTTTVVANGSITHTGATDGQDDSPGALIAVILLFIFCNTLGLLVNMVDSQQSMKEALVYLIDVSNLLTVVNSSVNCLIYTALSPAYRQMVGQILGYRRKNATTAPSAVSIGNHQYSTDSGQRLLQNAGGTSLSKVDHSRCGNYPRRLFMRNKYNGNRKRSTEPRCAVCSRCPQTTAPIHLSELKEIFV